MSGERQRIFFREAIGRAVATEMRENPRVIVIGQDVGAFGGAYREFDGLFEEFGPDRVRDTPVAESSMVGIGVGAAAAGWRPLVSITYMDFVMLGLDPLVNFAAKLRFKSGGRLTAPMVLKTTAGAQGQGVAHSQCLEAWLMSVPGIRVLAPSNPADAYGLLRAAFHEPGPVVFVDHKRLFPIPGEAPYSLEPMRIGEARIVRRGRHVTLATHSFMVRVAVAAAAQLEKSGIEVEVVDLRSLSPLDVDTLATSAAKTGALLTLEEGQTTCGVGAEIWARISAQVGGIPFARVGALPVPVSSNPILEAACIPGVARVVDEIRNLLAVADSATASEVG